VDAIITTSMKEKTAKKSIKNRCLLMPSSFNHMLEADIITKYTESAL